MTVEQGVADGDVKIRTTGRLWIWYVVMGGINLAMAVGYGTGGRPWFALVWLVLGCCNVGLGCARRTFGIDLTPDSAVVRGFRRRTVPWREVQAVVRHDKSTGSSLVRLILENGEPVTLRFPTSLRSQWDRESKGDFQRIDQWWQEHRGDSWRPVHPQAPGFVQAP
jgi:hypothetical protein